MKDVNLSEFFVWVQEQKDERNLPEDMTCPYYEGDLTEMLLEAIKDSPFPLSEWQDAWDTAASYIWNIGMKAREDVPYVTDLTKVLLDFAYQKYRAPKKVTLVEHREEKKEPIVRQARIVESEKKEPIIQQVRIVEPKDKGSKHV